MRKKDQNIVTAVTITEEQALIRYMEINKIDFELRGYSSPYDILYRTYIISIIRDKNYKVPFYPSKKVFFEKRACITCKKCMGWHKKTIKTRYRDSGYRIDEWIEESFCMEREFDIYVDNQIELIKLEEKREKDKIVEMDKAREERNEAIKICEQ